MFDTHPHVFAEVDKGTADLTLSKDSMMQDPTVVRVQMINFGHKHYLNSSYGLRAVITDMMPEVEAVLVKDEQRDIMVVNTFRYDLLTEPKKGDVSWWYEIIYNITPHTPSARDKLVRLAAYKIQNPVGYLQIGRAHV